MKRLKAVAAHIGLGIGAVYAFFLIPDIEHLFRPSFILLLRQLLALSFALCLLANPTQLIRIGELWGPKILQILNLLFSSKNNNNDSEADN